MAMETVQAMVLLLLSDWIKIRRKAVKIRMKAYAKGQKVNAALLLMLFGVRF